MFWSSIHHQILWILFIHLNVFCFLLIHFIKYLEQCFFSSAVHVQPQQ